jgi:hypothetical protein
VGPVLEGVLCALPHCILELLLPVTLRIEINGKHSDILRVFGLFSLLKLGRLNFQRPLQLV